MPYMELAIFVHIPVFCWAVYQTLKHGPNVMWLALALLSALILGRRVLWLVWGRIPEAIDRGLIPLMVTLLIALIAGAALKQERR